MKRQISRPVTMCLSLGIAAFVVRWSMARNAVAQNSPPQELAVQTSNGIAKVSAARPQYNINAEIDYDLLTLKSSAQITIPVVAGDSLKDVVFFIFANAGGVGSDDARRKNIAVDKVSLDGKDVPFKLDAAVLRVTLPRNMSTPFTLKVDYHGVVPRSAPGSGGLGDMMGALGTDISGLLGGAIGGNPQDGVTTKQPAKPKNLDYGLYTYGNGILSLGSFWYPSLAVRKNGKWIDEAPEGLGDVAYSEMSDFNVTLNVPKNVKIAATGSDVSAPDSPIRRWKASNVRDFSVLGSEDFVVKSKTFAVGRKEVSVLSYATKENSAKNDKAIDVAGRALQIFAKRFGPYPYSSFKVVEGPMRGGAGGMEYSGMTAIASMLYQDMGKQIEAMTGAMGLGGLDKLFGGDETGDGAAGMAGGILGEQKQILDSLFETTIAHEVAHQWWAISVGSDSQRAPFVDESLTNYSAMLYFEDRYGKERAQKMMDAHLRTTYSMGRMLGSTDAPVSLKTADYSNNLQYGAIVYGKGALYYDALRTLVGDDVFFRSLRQYFSEYSDKLAEPRALLQIVQRTAPDRSAQVNALFKRWIEESHGDDDITGGAPAGIGDLLGGLLGGNLPGALPDE